MKNIGIIGAGNIGLSLAKLLIKNGYGNQLILSDINKDLRFMNTGLWISDNNRLIKRSDVIFITVKPKQVKAVINDINNMTNNHDKFIVSAAAGTSLKYIEKNLEPFDYPIVRIMPNLPISLGYGAITYYPNKNVNEDNLFFLTSIFKGPYLLKVKNENLLNTSTILTASMPAFMTFIANEYINFGIREGFTKDEATQLYAETLKGTAELLKNNYGLPDEIIKKVATPNGVTEQGLEKLAQHRSAFASSAYASYNYLQSIKKQLD